MGISSVEHIILADPWGFVDEPPNPKATANVPYYLMCFLKMCESEPFNFHRLWPMRLPGRMGTWTEPSLIPIVA